MKIYKTVNTDVTLILLRSNSKIHFNTITNGDELSFIIVISDLRLSAGTICLDIQRQRILWEFPKELITITSK